MTPAHSHVDFEMSQRHKLPVIDIIDDDGCLINVPQSYLVIHRMFLNTIRNFSFLTMCSTLCAFQSAS